MSEALWTVTEDIQRLRSGIPALAALSDAAVEGMYRSWSEDMYCAGWMHIGDEEVTEFREWATATVAELPGE